MPNSDPPEATHGTTNNLSATAWSALHQNNWQKALEIIPHIDFTLDDVHHFRLLCCTYLQSQHWRTLSAVASIAAERFPAEPIFWEIWAWAEHIQGNTKAALKILESVIPTFCHRESTACILAYLYAASQRYSDAKRWSDFASRLPPDSRSIRIRADGKAEFHFAT
jgi:hypothetical protein